ncbi:MAG: carboxynorspermidine decarboxylase [Fastidiosipilaceae bacterium]
MTPAYVVDLDLLQRNLDLLDYVMKQSGAKILLAQKAFSMFVTYPQIAQVLAGTTASGLYEAKLGHAYFDGETHVFSPAFKPAEMDELCRFVDHIVFNSFSQWKRYREQVKAAPQHISCGLRINPEHSTQDTPLYDPCAPGSRLGITIDQFESAELKGIEGLHFHTLCEQGFNDLKATLDVFEEKFGKWLPQMKWLNLGGGHWITHQNYDVKGLIAEIKRLRDTYDVEVYLEPGEAVVLNTGFLVTEVLDFVENHGTIALLDASTECHMPDVLAMPYRPLAAHNGKLAGDPAEKAHTYRLSSCTCLAGDILGDYSFDKPLQAGDRLVLFDMALYTMVKNNTFNGMPLPAIYTHSEKYGLKCIRTFGYEDFKTRLS